MLSLGYSEYVTQGGDWGHVVRFFLPYPCQRDRIAQLLY